MSLSLRHALASRACLYTSKLYLDLLPSLFLDALKEDNGLDKQQHVETWPR
jgi:hypothetical protein